MSKDNSTPAIVVELENGRFVSAYGNGDAEGVEVFLVNRTSDDPVDDTLASFDFARGDVENREDDEVTTVDVTRIELTESPWGISALSAILDSDVEDPSIDETIVVADED